MQFDLKIKIKMMEKEKIKRGKSEPTYTSCPIANS